MTFQVSKNSVALCGIWCEKGMEKAAEQLSHYLTKITGAPYPILAERKGKRFEIVTDESVRYFAYSVEEECFLIAAPTPVKAGWGVFHMLDQLADCVFCTSTYEVIPKNPSLILDAENYVHSPAFEHNNVHYKDYFTNPLFEMKSGTSLMGYSEEDVAPMRRKWTCHTMTVLLGAEKYDEHPEYFCMRDGERLRPVYQEGLGGIICAENVQPCLSNPEVLEVICENLKKEMEERPEVLYWSVSQDDNFNYCQCPECAKIDEEEGSHMGSCLRFVNKVAERFPDKIISTLAYRYTRKPCKKTRPAKNVEIMLCNIEAYRDKPIISDPVNEEVKNLLLEWRGLTENLYYWDYCVNFENLISPFPNFHTIAENMKFFASGGVGTMFSQGNRETLGEFAELRAYYLAKLAANPYADPDAIIEKFCKAYYGNAAPYIITYINMLHDAMEHSGRKIRIFDKLDVAADSYLRRDLFDKYMALFEQAEDAVAGDAELLNHVKIARMPLYYVGVALGYGDKNQQRDMLAQFAKTAQENHVNMVRECGRDNLQKFVFDSMAKLA